METHLIEQRQPNLIRIPAKIISYIFHPLFIPTYIFIWLIIRFPYEFNIPEKPLKLRVFTVFWTSAFFPAFTVFLLWRLKLISSIYLRYQVDRIIPYVASMFFYWWLWYLSRNFTDQPLLVKSFFFGIFLSTIAGLIINNFIKISMHAMGVAGAWLFMVFVCFHYAMNLALDLSLVTLITGIVCSSRLSLSEHSTAEIYIGLGVGIICQLLAAYIAL